MTKQDNNIDRVFSTIRGTFVILFSYCGKICITYNLPFLPSLGLEPTRVKYIHSVVQPVFGFVFPN